MAHKQFVVKKVNVGLEMQNGVNLEGQNLAIHTLGLKLGNCDTWGKKLHLSKK
jgi:hypothetical protein